MTEAMIICQSLQVAKRPEDIFGAIHDGPLPERLLAVKRLFNDFIKVIPAAFEVNRASRDIHVDFFASLDNVAMISLINKLLGFFQ